MPELSPLTPRTTIVLDLDELLTGLRREGLFCGIVVQLEKFGTAGWLTTP